MEQRGRDPASFPGNSAVVFSEKEIAKPPGINKKIADPPELQHPKGTAPARLQPRFRSLESLRIGAVAFCKRRSLRTARIAPEMVSARIRSATSLRIRNAELDRRDFSRLWDRNGSRVALFARRFPPVRKIGHTGITWDNDSEAAVRECFGSRLHGFEETFETSLKLGLANPDRHKKIGQYKLPLIRLIACSFTFSIPRRRRRLRRNVAMGRLIKKNCGSVLGGFDRHRSSRAS